MTSFTISTIPVKCIHTQQDLESFNKSPVQQEILRFIQACAEAVVDIPNSKDDIHISTVVGRFVLFMTELHQLVETIPPIKQPMRFGNKAYRTWHEALPERIHVFLEEILSPDHTDKESELTPYLADMFGNATRIDYGTGHELNFALFFICLHKLGLIEERDFTAVITKGFVAYIKTMRKLQLDYMLEPAGSHGVWGLDDYHCLLFFWGSAQLSKQTEIRPSSIHDSEVLNEFADDYIYLEGIRFIKQIKLGAPFAETSPMLNDISNIPEWARVCSGLVRLFQGEVLNKLPVIQHVVFGSLLQCTWKDPSDSRSSTTSESQPSLIPSTTSGINISTVMPNRGSLQHHSLHTRHPHLINHSMSTVRPTGAISSSNITATLPTVNPIDNSSTSTADLNLTEK